MSANESWSTLDDGWWVHSLLAVAWQGTVMAALYSSIGLFESSVLGGAMSAAGFWMREQTQAEYRAIAANGGLRANIRWYSGLNLAYWNFGSYIDFLAPWAAVAIVCGIVKVLI